MSELKGSVALVTGAGQGLGRAVAMAFASCGTAVAVADINEDAAREVRDEIESEGGTALDVHVDVTCEESVREVAEHTSSQFGPVSVWVNNAGIVRPAMLHEMELEDFDAVLAVHARGTFLGMREAARQMLATQTSGCVINVTSSAGLQGTLGQINYAAAKGAITAMTKSAAKELARHHIRVNAVAPVAATPMTQKIRTDEKLRDRYLSQIPLGRFADPNEVAATFTFLASSEASYITGQVVCVDGGLYMAS